MLDEGRPEPARGPVVAVVGVLALLLVAGAAAAAVLLPQRLDDAPGAKAEAGRAATAGGAARRAPTGEPRLAQPLAGPTRAVAAGGVRFGVPRSPGWSVSAPGTLVGFDGASGTMLGGPAFLRRGWCAGDRRWSNRALIGAVPAAGAAARGPVRRVTRRAALRWRDALAGSRTAGPGGRTRVSRVRLADGTAAWLATGRTHVPADDAGCAPPAVAYAVLGVPVDGGVAQVVALRDVGVPDALPAAVVRRVLAGVRVAGAA